MENTNDNYKKPKPIKITNDNVHELKEFKNYRKKPIVIRATQMRFMDGFSIETLEGTMTGKFGDYLVIGIDGEMYPVDESIFERTYDEVE